MKALSIHSPWWWYILYGGKDIENRDWYTNYRGPVWIHASKWWDGDEIFNDIDDIHEAILESGSPLIHPRLSDLQPWGGAIVGSVEIAACVSEHNSRWFFGKFGFVLRNPVPLDSPVPLRGMPGFFDVPEGLIGDAA